MAVAMRFRLHRGSLAESMATERAISSDYTFHKQVEAAVRGGPCGGLPDLELMKRTRVELYAAGPDDRIGWDHTYIITVDGYGVVGFCDRPSTDLPTWDGPQPPAGHRQRRGVMDEGRKWPPDQPITIRVSIRTLTPEFEDEFGPIVEGFWSTLGSRPAVLKDAADVLGLVERHGRFDLVELRTSPGYQQTGEIVIEFENGYD